MFASVRNLLAQLLNLNPSHRVDRCVRNSSVFLIQSPASPTHTKGVNMKYSALFVALAVLGLSACEKTVVTPPPAPAADSPAPVVVPVVPGPPGPAGAPGAPGEPGPQGNTGGDTIVVVPPAPAEQKP